MSYRKSKRKNRRSKTIRASARAEDTRQRRKYAKGGRIEAYTFGEATKKRKDVVWR